MTRKEQIKILNDKIESNTNQYKVDRLNAEISAFSSGDLNKYELLTRKDLKYKPNELDKARFEFSPLGKAFSTRLDKTADGYQEVCVIKLLKDIRDGLAGGNKGNGRNGGDDDSDDDDNADMPDLETEEEAAERIVVSYEQKNESKTNDDDKIKNLKDKVKKLKDRILYLEANLEDSKLSIEEKDKLYKELIKSNDKSKDFTGLYNDIIEEEQNKIYKILNKFENDMNNLYEKENDMINILDNKIFKVENFLNEKGNIL